MLVVSAYYSIPSKEQPNFYYPNIQRFFKYVTTPVMFFTDVENYAILKEWAGSNVRFIIQNFESLDIFKDFSQGFWQDQVKIDPEKYHTWQLGALWASKTRFVKQASQIDPTYDWYMWVDAGCVRNDDWKICIDAFGKRKVPDSPGVYIQLLKSIPDHKSFFQFPDVYVAGSHILLHKSYIDNYNELYAETLKTYESQRIPAIMDQYIIASMIKTATFIYPILYDPQLNVPCEWFFFFSVF